MDRWSRIPSSPQRWTRRDMLKSTGLLGMLAASPALLSACSSQAKPAPHVEGHGEIALADVQRFFGGAGSRPAAVMSVQSLTAELYQKLAAAKSGNLVCSPYSVAEALGMTRNGARGQTATEMDHVLHIDDLGKFNEGIDSLALLLASRAGEIKRADGSKATISLDVANSLWGQKSEQWEQPFLEALARYYGTGMRMVDYRHAPEAARLAINSWVSGRTHAKIPELIPQLVLDDLTRLVLVNAIYLKAPWETPFDRSSTERGSFSLDTGRVVSTDLMTTAMPVVLTDGPGWSAARLPYAGGRLAMTLVVPNFSLDKVERSLDADTLHAMITGDSVPQKVTLTMPKWKFRSSAELNDPLATLGMPTAFDSGSADFSGMTKQESLFISAVLHQAYISVDEHGTEAAAATAVIMEASSAQAPPTPFVVDRAFLFVIHDVDSAAPLFIGRVADPTVS